MPITLRLILGDQLNSLHSWFTQPNPSVRYLMMEMRQETDYVRHHIQKIHAFFLAMRHFAQELKQQGHRVHYLTLDDPSNTQSLTAQLQLLIEKEGVEKFEYQLPDEYRLDQLLKNFCLGISIPSEAVDT